MCIGQPGCQKTTLLTTLNNNNEDTIVLSFANKACSVVRNLLKSKQNKALLVCKDEKQEDKYKKITDNVTTFHKFFSHGTLINKKYKRIQIDEFSMVPTEWLSLIYKIKCSNPEICIQMYGDPKQCKQVCKYKRYFNYLEKKCVRYICDNNLIVKKYVEGCGRYNIDLHDVLRYLEVHRCLPEYLNNKKYNIDETIKQNIVCTNYEKDLINDRFLTNTDWYVGMKIIANITIKSMGISKSELFTIKSFDDKLFVEEIEEEVKKQWFVPAFAVTVYKYQGSEIIGYVNIHEIEYMDLNELYTALSRCKSLDQLRFEYTDKVFKPASEPINSTNIELDKYQIGYIYLLTNQKHNKFYVGQTSTSIQQRFKEHINNPKDCINSIDGEWTYEQVSVVYYNEKENLLRTETNYIHYYSQNGYDLLNTLKMPKKIENKIYSKVVIEEDNKFEVKKDIVTVKSGGRFKIVKGNSFYRIQDRVNGSKIDVIRTWGKKITEVQAYESKMSTRAIRKL